ncbi:Uncharacterised protein [Vibrio cholerae]|uniref:Uncharacterized protein n=1 Tax=Vibrio cholerae TaxID=666 RepID=A0A655PXF2_VIBCL|nr:Uncharacterised protein [Vibrio cholerae]CSB98248.1 Uncharacterised protein [Vibrio cholerae]CSC54647.1 Uncharacterised protein [Vibrio cholerae]CSC90106.1 Uncharacterised protein [Vibrio cholerae]
MRLDTRFVMAGCRDPAHQSFFDNHAQGWFWLFLAPHPKLSPAESSDSARPVGYRRPLFEVWLHPWHFAARYVCQTAHRQWQEQKR